ncbi:hypothetical protein TNCV_545701 [Trichonephila clavipes]|nr:hypothetical protein TNCV_545701 [Trichonephila clavipes]
MTYFPYKLVTFKPCDLFHDPPPYPNVHSEVVAIVLDGEFGVPLKIRYLVSAEKFFAPVILQMKHFKQFEATLLLNKKKD